MGLTVWNLARNDLRRMRTEEMDPEGELLTRAGKTCGLVGVVLGGGLVVRVLGFFPVGCGPVRARGGPTRSLPAAACEKNIAWRKKRCTVPRAINGYGCPKKCSANRSSARCAGWCSRHRRGVRPPGPPSVVPAFPPGCLKAPAGPTHRPGRDHRCFHGRLERAGHRFARYWNSRAGAEHSRDGGLCLPACCRASGDRAVRPRLTRRGPFRILSVRHIAPNET